MPKQREKKTRLSVPVTTLQKKRLQDMADENDVSLARVVQEAIRDFLRARKGRRLPLFKRPPPKG
jgi:hypothetical protein